MFYERVDNMARVKKSDVKQVEYRGFANVSLTKPRKAVIKKMVEEGADYDKWLENLTSDGYKISISWVSDPGYFSVTAYQTQAESDHAGWGTTARHGDLQTAFATIFYFVYVVLREEGWPDANANYEW
jgi:hypothetical protein